MVPQLASLPVKKIGETTEGRHKVYPYKELKGESYVDIKTLLDIIANQGFPIALSILLIFRIDKFMQEIVIAQKEGYRQVLENTKEIHSTITSLNQQNREYYSLRFAEVQKELSAMKVELGSPR